LSRGCQRSNKNLPPHTPIHHNLFFVCVPARRYLLLCVSIVNTFNWQAAVWLFSSLSTKHLAHCMLNFLLRDRASIHKGVRQNVSALAACGVRDEKSGRVLFSIIYLFSPCVLLLIAEFAVSFSVALE